MSQRFELVSDYTPAGDQPEAIASLVEGLEGGLAYQTLLGVTGSGKTFTIANVIDQLQRPTLVLAHTKTLAASSFRGLSTRAAISWQHCRATARIEKPSESSRQNQTGRSICCTVRLLLSGRRFH